MAVTHGGGPRHTGAPRPGPRPRAVAARAALCRRFRDTVPARLRLLRAVTASLTAALAVLLLVAGLAMNGTWDGVDDRDAPRTTSAAELALALNDMDAQAADILLADGDAGKGRLRTPYAKAVGFYGDARREIGHDLRTLAVAAQEGAAAPLRGAGNCATSPHGAAADERPSRRSAHASANRASSRSSDRWSLLRVVSLIAWSS
ncbi:hypothetical protein [Streptomyces pseudovenezuelae]|uniref:hypothetical protein n=1 Tax=Streptomyces pseudovenezuelae TaxID=67350 RepID=UPI0036EE8FEE